MYTHTYIYAHIHLYTYKNIYSYICVHVLPAAPGASCLIQVYAYMFYLLPLDKSYKYIITNIYVNMYIYTYIHIY